MLCWHYLLPNNWKEFWIFSVGTSFLVSLYYLVFTQQYFRVAFNDITLSLKGLDVPDLDLGSGLNSGLGRLRGELTISANHPRGLGNPLFLSLGFFSLLEMAVMIGIIYQARQFIGNIVLKTFFVPLNVKRLKWMGHLFFASILISVLRMVFVRIYLASSGLLPVQVSYYSKEVWINVVDGIISVFICYVFAGIFQYGKKKKKDQELTI